MSKLAEELRDLQAVCERFGVDDDDVLNRAADTLSYLELRMDIALGSTNTRNEWTDLIEKWVGEIRE